MLQNLGGAHAIIILVVILLLFGAAKLPALAKSVGQSMRIFKSEVRTGREEDAARENATAEPARDDRPQSTTAAPLSPDSNPKP